MTATATATKPTFKDLRAEVERLGITPDLAGCPIDELVRRARENEDPLGYLAIHAPEPPATAAVDTGPYSDEAETEPIGDVPAPLPGPPAGEAPIVVVSLTAPISGASLETCYISRHADVRLSLDQGLMLRRLYAALDQTGLRLANGRRVANPPDAIRWLLEQLGGSARGA